MFAIRTAYLYSVKPTLNRARCYMAINRNKSNKVRAYIRACVYVCTCMAVDIVRLSCLVSCQIFNTFVNVFYLRFKRMYFLLRMFVRPAYFRAKYGQKQA